MNLSTDLNNFYFVKDANCDLEQLEGHNLRPNVVS